MKTMKWLLRREYWEHKGSLFIAPLAVAGIMLALSIASLASFTITVGPEENVKAAEVLRVYQSLSPQKQEAALGFLSNLYMGFGLPILLVMAFTVFMFCVNSLFDERRDRSILFWKSLPISDSATVLSKAAMALVLAPVFAFIVSAITALLQVLIFACFTAIEGASVFGLVFSTPRFFMAPIYVLTLLPVYALWALPTVGWLLLVSSWARGKALVWAVGVPLLAGMIASWSEKAMNIGWDASWFWENIVARGLLGLLPGLWLKVGGLHASDMMAPAHYPDLALLVSRSWSTLLQPQVWIGAAVGAAMIYGAIRLRGSKEED
ncbi:MAG TPA: hypothetical protein VIT92_00910 [Burkholderiaceae bacterium]